MRIHDADEDDKNEEEQEEEEAEEEEEDNEGNVYVWCTTNINKQKNRIIPKSGSHAEQRKDRKLHATAYSNL